MAVSVRRFHVLKRHDLAWLLPLVIGTWVVLGCAGLGADLGFLAGMSIIPIGITAYLYRDGSGDPLYWAVLALYALLHAVALYALGGSWIPRPAILLSPIFLLDYFVLAYLFPKLSGMAFDMTGDCDDAGVAEQSDL